VTAILNSEDALMVVINIKETKFSSMLLEAMMLSCITYTKEKMYNIYEREELRSDIFHSSCFLAHGYGPKN